ncbi:fibroblast growth factor receptor-like 1 [Mytilus trossulus]|uniref:fibroblast growth factor receptor-like 1 n=1 Tax=Mytilus trossulus TaxID=6551 RepID=UPI0030078C53
MDLYYLLVQRSFLWTVQLLITFLISTEGGFSYKRILDRRQLRVGFPPEILADAQNITVHRNDRAILNCTIRHRGTKNVQWGILNSSHPLTIGDLTWTSDKRFSVSSSNYNKTVERWNLVIDNVQPKDTNTYECQISSIVTRLRLVHLTVLPTQRKISPGVSLKGTTLLDSRGTIIITCNATGAERAPESVDWFHEGSIIRQQSSKWSGRVKISMKADVLRRSLISQLIIERSTLKDRGAYICRSPDKIMKSIEVHILEDNNPPSRAVRNKLSDEPAKPNKAALSTLSFIIFIMAVSVSAT